MVIETPKNLPAFDRANLALLGALVGTARVGPRTRRRLMELRELTLGGVPGF